MPYKHVALIGLGLISASIALSLRRVDKNIRITGTSRSRATREKALELGICEVCDDSIEAVKNADLIILCVPVGAMASVVKEFVGTLKSGVTLTDVGSVKVEVIASIMPLLHRGIEFIPGHPLAGTENSGPESGFASLFDNRWCLLTPLEESPVTSIERLKSFWESLGAKVDQMEAAHHDLVLAVTSHVPHLIAYTMVGVADDLANITKSEGNLKMVGVGGNYDNLGATFAVDAADSEGWYWEYRSIGNDGSTVIGFADPQNAQFNQSDPTGSFTNEGDGKGYMGDGNKRNNNSAASYGNSWTGGDIIGIAVKSGAVYFYKNQP